MTKDIDNVRVELRAYPDVPGVRSLLIDADERLWCAVKERHAVTLIHRGRSEWWSRRGVLSSGPGAIHLGEPADVRKDLRREGAARFQIVTFDPDVIRDHVERRGVLRSSSLRSPMLDRQHPDRRALLALHRAYRERTDTLTRQVIVAEALDAFAGQLDGGRALPGTRAARPRLRRAVEHIHADRRGTVTLDDLATTAGLDRYHFCRAFREEYGLPPYAYALKVRLARACELLAAGTPAGSVASDLGFCDQSQLHRHFRRALGITPGAYARAGRLGRIAPAFGVAAERGDIAADRTGLRARSRDRGP